MGEQASALQSRWPAFYEKGAVVALLSALTLRKLCCE